MPLLLNLIIKSVESYLFQQIIKLLLFFSIAISVADGQSSTSAEKSQFGSPSPALAQLYRNKELSRQWHKLLHAYPASSAKPSSRIDSPSFFLSSRGKEDPTAELEVTYERLFGREIAAPEQLRLRCSFPLRYEWLREALSVNQPPIEQLCPELLSVLGDSLPQGISLVYPQYYLGNPASMFGHTFLLFRASRIRGEPSVGDRSLTFGADSKGERGLVFALKGLFGGYRGKFYYAPYYERLKQYGDIDKRDIWEYELSLNSSQIRRLMLHLKELELAEIDYYFLDENCTTHLLTLLDVASPDLALTERAPLAVVPVEALKEIAAQAGLVKAVHFRPSKLSQLAVAGNTLSREALELLENDPTTLLRDKQRLNLLPQQEQAMVLDSALLLLSEKESLETPQVRDELLLERSKLILSGSNAAKTKIQGGDQPELGHGISRFSAGVTVDRSQSSLEFGLRPLYHAIEDRTAGYLDASELSLFYPIVNYNIDANQFALKSLQLVSLASLSPGTRLTRRWSWSINLGLEREKFSSSSVGGIDSDLSAYAELGGGVSRALGPLAISLLATNLSTVADDFGSNFVTATGPKLVIRWPLSEADRIISESKFVWVLNKEGQMISNSALSWVHDLDRSWSVTATVKTSNSFIQTERSYNELEGGLSIIRYF